MNQPNRVLAMAVVTMLGMVTVAVINASATSKPASCQDLYQEYTTVAAVATSTGRVPGMSVSLPMGTELTANPPCVASRGNEIIER